MSRSERIAQQLGMSHGAAAGKLRKKILFSMLVRLKENVCFKCGKSIETDDELSIEHKQPWEGRSTDLFWDLQNISFSHCACNRPHHSWQEGKPSHKRIVSPEGTAWCRTCKVNHPVEQFAKNRTNWNGLRRDCRKIEKQYKDKIRGNISEDGGDGLQSASNTEPTFTG